MYINSHVVQVFIGFLEDATCSHWMKRCFIKQNRKRDAQSQIFKVIHFWRTCSGRLLTHGEDLGTCRWDTILSRDRNFASLAVFGGAKTALFEYLRLAVIPPVVPRHTTVTPGTWKGIDFTFHITGETSRTKIFSCVRVKSQKHQCSRKER